MNEGSPGTALPFLPSVRASVERGDPLKVRTRSSSGGVMGGRDLAGLSAPASPLEPYSPEPVAADAQVLDAQPDDGYLHRVLTHPVDSDWRPAQALDGGEAVPRASWSESDRLAFLARAQRVDPRTAK